MTAGRMPNLGLEHSQVRVCKVELHSRLSKRNGLALTLRVRECAWEDSELASCYQLARAVCAHL